MATESTNPFKAAEERKRKAAEERRKREEEERRMREEQESKTAPEEENEGAEAEQEPVQEETPAVVEAPAVEQETPAADIDEPVVEGPSGEEVKSEPVGDVPQVVVEMYDRYAEKHMRYKQKPRRDTRLQCVFPQEYVDEMRKMADKGEIKSANDLLNTLVEDFLRGYRAKSSQSDEN